MIGIIASLIGMTMNAIGGNWMAALWAFCAFGWATVAYLERRASQRYKAAATTLPWCEVGTFQRRTDGGYEIWDGKNWTRV